MDESMHGGQPMTEMIDLTTGQGRQQINTIRLALEDATNYDKVCKEKNFKLMLESTTSNRCGVGKDADAANEEDGAKQRPAALCSNKFALSPLYSVAHNMF